MTAKIATESAAPVVAAQPPRAAAGAADAARADVGVEERQRRAQAMLKRFARHESLRSTVIAALLTQRSSCLDEDAELSDVADAVVQYIAASADARFVRELLGDDPADRMTRMHAHGALLDRATQAAWRLAGGE